MTERGRRPPRVAVSILAALLPEAYRDAVLGDLAEEYDLRSRDGRFPRLWYWGQVFRPDVWRLRSEARGELNRTTEGAAMRWDVFFLEFRQALRVFRRSPGFVAAAVLTLATGIAGITVIFSLVNGLLLSPIPGIEDSGSVVAIQSSQGGGSFGVSTYLDLLDFDERAQGLVGVAAFKPRTVEAGTDGNTQPLGAAMVTSGYFDLVGVRPQLGRFFGPEVDDGPGAHPEAVLTDRLWRSAFGTDPEVVGRMLVVNGQSYTVIGVAPAGFRGTQVVEVPDFFVPMTMQPNLMPESGYLLDRRSWGGVLGLARLVEGGSLTAANEEIRTLAAQLAAEYPNTNESRSYRLIGLREASMPGSVRSSVVQLSVGLLAIVGALWLVVCLNVSNLLLARSWKRRQELAIRRALGSGRGRIAGQLMLEFMAIALAAGLVGMLFARMVVSAVDGLPIPIAVNVGLDLRTVLVAGILALASGLLCSLAPAVVLSRTRAGSGSARTPESGRRRWPSRVLIVGQVAVSLVLVFATSLFVRSFANLATADPGFDSNNILTARFMPDLQGYGAPEMLDFYRRLVDASAAIPGVEAVTMADGLPETGNFGQDSWFFENVDDPTQGSTLYRSVVATNFFEVMGIPVVEGRGFSDFDTAERPPVLVLNGSAARVVESRTGRPAVGQRIGPGGPEGPFFEIIGVVGDTRTGRSGGAAPFVYGSHGQLLPLGLGGGKMVVMLKTTGSPESLAAPLRAAALEVDANVSATNVVTMEAFLADLLSVDRLTVSVLGVSSVLAMLLVAIGVYGLLAYVVGQRTREFGVRLALGAEASNLTLIVVREALGLAVIGLALGASGALLVLRLAESQLVGVRSSDPISLTAGVLIVVGVTLAAAYAPARKATRIDPVRAIQAE